MSQARSSQTRTKAKKSSTKQPSSRNSAVMLEMQSASGIAIQLKQASVCDFQQSKICCLQFEVDFQTYQQILEHRLFHLGTGIAASQGSQSFLTEANITINACLAPDLLGLVAKGQKGKKPLEQNQLLTKLRSCSIEHELRNTDSWIAQSVTQRQPDGNEVGYQTLWASIDWQSMGNNWFENDAFTEAMAEPLFQRIAAQWNGTYPSDILASLDPLNPDLFASQLKTLIETVSPQTDLPESDTTTENLSGASGLSDSSETLNAAIADMVTLLKDLSEDVDSGESLAEDPSNIDSEETYSEQTCQPDLAQVRTTPTVCIEERQPLIQSQLWALQRQYFQSHSAKTKGSSQIALTAQRYAELIDTFIQECQTVTQRFRGEFVPFEPSKPIYILDLGAGTGQLAFHLLTQLQALRAQRPQEQITLKYVLSDFHENAVADWQQREKLKPFFETGLLDMATFDLASPDAITLKHSGEDLSPDTLKNPLIVIANDVFGVLPQAAYTLEAGKTYDNLVSLMAPADVDASEPLPLASLTVQYERAATPCTRTQVSSDIARYCRSLSKGHFLWPQTAFAAIDTLRSLSDNRLLLLSTDVAYTQKCAVETAPVPLPALSDYATFPVNYHAFAEYARYHSGQVLQPTQNEPGICTQALIFGSHPNYYSEMRSRFHQPSLAASDAASSLLTQLVADHADTLSLSQIVAYLRSQCWDADAFLSCFKVLFPQLESASDAVAQDIIQGIHLIWERYFTPVETDTTTDLAFCLGMVLYSLGEYAGALEYFEKSRQGYGDDPNTLYNLAMCHYQSGDIQSAIQYLKATIKISPDFEAAESLLQELI